MIKAAFFDVDGTLFSRTLQKIPEDALETLHLLHRQGILVFLATGRHPLEVDQLEAGCFDFDGFITANGQLVLDQSGRLLWHHPFSAEACQELAALAAQKCFPMSLAEANRLYFNYLDEQVLLAQKEACLQKPELGSWNGAPLYGGSVFLDESKEEMVRSLLPKGVCLTRWSDFGMDFCLDSSGKAMGLQAVGTLFDIAPEEMIAFGDSFNDLSMLEFAGISVAMGGAKADVKKAADYVTSRAHEGGIRQACLHFGLLDPALCFQKSGLKEES